MSVEVIMRDNSTAQAKDVLDQLIKSEVENTLKNNEDEFNFDTKFGIREAASAIAYFMNISLKLEVPPLAVEREIIDQVFTRKFSRSLRKRSIARM